MIKWHPPGPMPQPYYYYAAGGRVAVEVRVHYYVNLFTGVRTPYKRVFSAGTKILLEQVPST